MTDCLFCSIAAGDIPATMVHDGAEVLAFRDINPQAPVHILVIPRVHLASAADLTPAHDGLWAQMLRVTQSLAESEGIAREGFRVVTNVGHNGGQTVNHLHLHLLGGRAMGWPPG
ncbi:MAG: histidine triad nucleotide-binding protein [Candidatus Dormibacteraeota bacterium]|nr:histidine triad nucleotide-binding protein [Candidatus Dormibacteraeota bacterium]